MSQDYIALEWVKGEIEETLQQARQALEAYVDNPKDKSQIKFCLSYLHQINGTLQMVEFYGAALLAEEMEAVCQSILDTQTKDERISLECLMQAIIQLPHYLEHIKVGRRDLPVVLLPILNELRSARGESLLSETALFSPVIQPNPELSPAQAKAVSSQEFLQWARKVRQMLQNATLQLLQNKEPQVAKQYLIRAFARLHKTLGHTPQGQVWLPALAFSEWLEQQQHLPSSARQLLRQLDSLLKEGIELGAVALNRPAPDELIKNLLFYVARTDVQSEAIAQVQEQFHLRQALPTEAELQQEREAFARPDRHTISDVLAVLIEEITAVKDGLDLLVRGQGDRLAALPELATSLKHIADTMGMLGLGMPRTVILEQLNLITQMQSSQASSDGILLDVAGALLYIEATLSGMQREGNFNAYVKETALSDAQKAVLREARNVLEEVKDAVIAYIANHWATNELLETPAMLHSIEGSLSMIPLPRVAGILAQSASFVKKVIEQQEQVPWPLLDTFADILSSVEYFLERYNEDARHADKNLLERAEQALLKLKHPVTPVTGDTEENLSFAGAENLPSLTIGQFSNTDARVIEEEILLDDNTPFDDEDETAPAPVIAAAPPTPAAPAPLMPVIEADDDLIDEEIIEIFLEEAEEVLEAIQGFWPVFKQDNNDKEALTTVRRSFHTLKGSGRMVKALVVGELAWSIENMFNRVLDNTISLSGNLVALVDHVIEQLPVLIDDFRHKRAPSVATQPLMAYAFALAQGQNVPTFSAAAMQADAPTPQADTSQPEPAVIPVQETLAAPQPAALGHKSEDDDEDDSLFDIFAQEARSHLETVDEFVELSVVEDYFNPLSDQLQRALHTLKGSAYMAQVDKIAQIAAPLEKFIKELRTYQVSNKPEIVAILTRASQIIADALDNPEQLVMSALPSSEAYLLELHDLEDLLLGDLQKNGANGSGLNPQAIAHFMEHGMDALLDADTLLQQWHNANDRSVLQLLRHDLSEASTGAAAAELPHVQQLADALNHFYGRLEDNHGDASNDFFSLVAEAHEALLTMLDCLAAGQETTSPASLIARLEAWQFTATTPTQNEDSEDLAVPELEIELEAPENYAELPVGEDAELLAIFLEEAQEISESVEAAMQRWRANPDDLLQVAQLQRELHTLKGGARMAEINSIADLCHELETLYERINDGRIRIEAGLFTLLQQAHDELSIQLELLQQGKMPHASKCLLAIQSYLSGQPISAAPVPADTPALSLVAPAAPLSTVQSSALDEADREILEIFMEEASELQEALEHALQDWEKAPSENTPAEEAQRVLHTLKGGARLAGLSLIGDIAHNFESDIVRAVQSPQAPDAIFFQHAYAQQDLLHHELEKVQKALSGDQFIALSEPSLTIEPFVPASAEAATPSASGDYLPAQHDDQDGHDDSADPSANSNVVPLRTTKKEASTRQNTAPQAKAPQELIKVSADLLDNLVNLAGETSIGRGRLEQQATDFSHTLEEMDETLERLRDQLRRLDMETEAQVLFRQERQGPTYEDFDPLEMDRYSTMQQLSRALVESASELMDLLDTLVNRTRDTETLLLQQSRVNTELQEGLMKTRMVPFQRLVPRLRRIVRQVSQELGKQVELNVFNADGEMDRSILERMISPLEHMLRNAVDHGIETQEQRQKSGKDALGNINLTISREGGDVLISMQDDGRGINIAAVRKKALERGLLTEDSPLTDAEVMQFILQAGFSTAEQVTQISGRGVGMDVVASEIKQMGGSIEIYSQPGAGTNFIVRLPFTVSVNRALMVRMSEDLYAIPLNNIQGIVRIPAPQILKMYAQPSAERKYEYAGVEYQVDYLGHLLDDKNLAPNLSGNILPLPMLLVRGAVPFALQVDSLLGSREIVVKALGPQFAGVKGVSGGTILGDGSVVIILDLPAMIRAQTSLEYQQARALDVKQAERRQVQQARLPRILVVDDSVTVRKVTTRLLERNGMEVLTAKDGVDALSVLQEHKPDLILLDIEMPRMDGFEVATQVRHDSRLKEIPIIMITSRTGDKHRERAMSIGVNEYLGKPFQEDILLSTMSKLLKHEELA